MVSWIGSWEVGGERSCCSPVCCADCTGGSSIGVGIWIGGISTGARVCESGRLTSEGASCVCTIEVAGMSSLSIAGAGDDCGWTYSTEGAYSAGGITCSYEEGWSWDSGKDDGDTNCLCSTPSTNLNFINVNRKFILYTLDLEIALHSSLSRETFFLLKNAVRWAA